MGFFCVGVGVGAADAYATDFGLTLGSAPLACGVASEGDGKRADDGAASVETTAEGDGSLAEGVVARFFAVSVERRIRHPAVAAICETARTWFAKG